MVRWTAIALTTLLANTGVLAQGASGDTESAIRAVVDRLFDGMRKNDSSMVRPLFHAKARLISTSMRDGAPVVQVQESVEGFITAVGRPHPEVWDERLSNVKIMIDGPLASVWTDYTFHRGTTFSHCGIDHFLLVKEGAEWKILELADTRRTNC